MTDNLRIRGVTLPDGDEHDLYIRAGRITFLQDDDAKTLLDEAYIIPGLVDAHAHLPFASPGPKEASWEEKARASARTQLDTGVLALRDPGGPTPASMTGSDLPHIITAGRFLAAPGRMYPEHGQVELPPDEIPDAAEEQFRSSGAWVKLIGDFPVPGKGFQTSFSPEIIAEVVRRIHALGGKVAIHAVHPTTIEGAIEAGVDSIEHGVLILEVQMGEMAKKGIALVPTMVSTSAWLPGILNQMGAPESQIEETAAAVADHPKTVRAAWEAGVTLLAGTDAGLVAHGLVRDEVRLLISAGIDVADALAAGSWRARSYFGLSGIDEGAPADLVAYRRNPLEDPGVLDEPALIIRNGRVVHSRFKEAASSQ